LKDTLQFLKKKTPLPMVDLKQNVEGEKANFNIHPQENLRFNILVHQRKEHKSNDSS